MRRTCVVGAVLAALSAACSTTGVGHGASVSPPPPDDSPSPSPSPTGSPVPDSPLVTGAAGLNLSGELVLDVRFGSLDAPAVWAPPPAPMDLTWQGPGPQELTLAGTSFLTRAETSAERTLSFTVNGPNGPVDFNSAAGECSITITPALPDNMGGIFTCTALTDLEGETTVDARGLFSATG